MKNNNGFTLVEMVITIALIGVVIVISSDFILNLVSSSIRIQNENILEQNYTFTTTKIVKMIQEADSVDIVSSNLMQIYLNGRSYSIQVQNGGIYVNNELISSPNVTVGQSSSPSIFSFINVSNPTQIKIHFSESIDSGLGERFSALTDFERIITVRKSYKN